jgi:signal transduction histidine kinase
VRPLGQTRIEWALLAIIAVVCAVLAFLQYRWTGELSRAEPALLRNGLNEQVRRLAQSFNEEIRENCLLLLPEAAELREHGAAEAHRVRYQGWASSHDRSVFTRIGVVVADQGILKLYGIDAEGRISSMEWPPGWETLRAGMTARMNGRGRPPSAPMDSTLIEIPVFAGSAAVTAGPEIEWMIFELNPVYVRARLLSRFVAEYLNPSGDAVYDASVSWAGPGERVIFSTRSDGASVTGQADSVAGIFPANISPTGTGSALGRGRGRGRDEGRWTIAVRHRAGSLDAAVSRARTRNLVAALVLVVLLGGTAAALVRFTARSRRLSEMQFRFVAGVSHDLRTPLTAIRGAAFNLVEGVVSEPAAIRRYLKLILRNAEELTSMIENVLAFSASTHKKAEDRCEAFAVGDLVQHAASAMTQEIEQAGCHIELTIAPRLPAVFGDRIAVELVFRNLIGNAVRHGAGGKWIGVSAARYSEGVEVRVCDRGPGIPEAERERIFEPFYRGEQTRARRVQGTGLGLSLVKETVERHKGTIEVHSSPADGTRFTVRLPAVPEAA